MASNIKQDDPRPLSPHLQIYRWQITMAMSIVHRITGVILTGGSLLIVAWLWAAAYGGQDTYAVIYSAIHHPLGKIALICWSAAFYYHFASGLRHLFWDIGWGFEIPTIYKSGAFVLMFTIIFTFVTWFGLLKGWAS